MRKKTMTKDEALKLALEALKWSKPHADAEITYNDAITAIKEALAQPEQDNTYTYASSLATTIWQKHYMKDSPNWKPLDTTDGVLTQIDNMTCGLVKEKPAQPEPEYLAFMDTPQRTWVGLMDEEWNAIYYKFAERGASVSGWDFAKAIEAKLKEKNT